MDNRQMTAKEIAAIRVQELTAELAALEQTFKAKRKELRQDLRRVQIIAGVAPEQEGGKA